MLRPVFGFIASAIFFFIVPPRVLADGAGDNLVDKVRRVPPPGIQVPDDVRRELGNSVDQLGEDLRSLGNDLTQKPALLALLPDIQIFHKAVDWALRYDEFYRTNEFEAARRLLEEARRRIAAIREEKPYWAAARGLVVRGYRSEVDGSVQPYGLVVPESYDPHAARVHRLDLWFHGRGEQLTELAFLDDRMRRIGEFAPRDAFVLHPYGRYCNGSRFAGETDAWEALADVEARYPIDEQRLVVRGFSLGGASCWHLATHYAARWAAAAPGAGFSETAEFLRVFQNETLQPSWWEQKLWRLYDSTAQALNVSMVPLVAYSGEKDRQIQAARAMERAMNEQGLSLTHIIGPNTEHRYEPAAKAEVNRRVDSLAMRGRDALPQTVRFVTHSLRYNHMGWVTLDALGQHWEPARVIAELGPEGTIRVQTRNILAFTLEMDSGTYPFPPDRTPRVTVDDRTIEGTRPGSDRSWRMAFHKAEAGWEVGALAGNELRKVHGLQGPIDDAFMDSFLFVRPTGTPLNAGIGAWVQREFAHAVEHWRRQFRGDARVIADTEVTDGQLATNHVVAWGDPQSNALLGRVAGRLPIRWDSNGVHTPDHDYGAEGFVPVLIYPNPLSPTRYLVVNSSFTFREYDYLNNARQTPKLPDWAIVDTRQPVTSRALGGIAAAGFFGERWEWRGDREW